MAKFSLRKVEKKTNKGVSELLSYVILIFIVISLWALVYIWIRASANISPPVDCKEETSVVLGRAKCQDGWNTLALEIKNNGRFNVDGVIVSVGDNPQDTPTVYLMPYIAGSSSGQLEGYYFFESPLVPGEIKDAVYKNQKKDSSTYNINEIKNIQIQPFIIEKKTKIICKNALIKQEIQIEPCSAI